MSRFDGPLDVDRAFDAVREGDLASVLALGDVNVVNGRGQSLLAAAIVARKTPIVLVLLQKGADPNGTTERDRMPILQFSVEAGAVGTGGIELCELLLQHGADVRQVDARRNTVLHVAADQGPMALYAAYMTRYLLGAGADVRAVNAAGQTPLHRAVQTVGKGVVQALVRAGAPVDTRDSQGRTAGEIALSFWSGDREHAHLADEYAALLRSNA